MKVFMLKKRVSQNKHYVEIPLKLYFQKNNHLMLVIE